MHEPVLTSPTPGWYADLLKTGGTGPHREGSGDDIVHGEFPRWPVDHPMDLSYQPVYKPDVHLVNRFLYQPVFLFGHDGKARFQPI